MAKLIPSHIEYDLGIALGRIVVNKELTVYDDTGEAQVRLSLEEGLEDTAAVLLNVAKYLLDRIGDRAVTERLLKEASLGGVSLGQFSLGESPYDLKVLRLGLKERKVKETSQQGLTEETKQTLLAGGIDPDVIRYLSCLDRCRHILNTSVNPLKAARTMIAKEGENGKPGFRARFAKWLANNPAPVSQEISAPCSACGGKADGVDPKTNAQLCYSCFDRQNPPAAASGGGDAITTSKAFAVEEDLDV